jgi:hypothetical protein
MSRLRETLDEVKKSGGSPTGFPTDGNRYQARCGVCDEMFYVDEATYDRVRRAVEFDPSDNPFRCDECEEEYEEDAVS